MSNLRRSCIAWTLAALAAAPAYAARYYVHPTLGNDTNLGISWLVPLRTLDEALTRAASTPNDPDEIWVVQGTYFPSVVFLDPNDPTPPPATARRKTFRIPIKTQVFGGFLGPSTQFPSGEMLLTQRNPEVNLTTLNGDLDANGDPIPDGITTNNCYHVVYFQGADAETKLSGFTIKNGNADHPTVARDARGGGIGMHTDDGAPLLNRLRVVNNRARLGGGGMHCAGKAVTYATNCVFESNTVTDGIGGGVLAREGGTNMQNCVLRNNTAMHPTDGRGGGFASEPSPTNVFSELHNCTFAGNQAAIFGGAVFSAMFDTASIGISNSVVWGNPDAAGRPVLP